MCLMNLINSGSDMSTELLGSVKWRLYFSNRKQNCVNLNVSYRSVTYKNRDDT